MAGWGDGVIEGGWGREGTGMRALGDPGWFGKPLGGLAGWWEDGGGGGGGGGGGVL